MSLKVPFIQKAVPNANEEIIAELYALAEEEIDVLINKGYTQAYNGRQDLFNNNLRGGNVFWYLIYYGINIRNFIERTKLITNEPICSLIEDKYEIRCVERNLECLSTFHNVDYVGFWEKAKGLLGINDCNETVVTCCLGIGQMIIEGDDCKAFKIGTCSVLQEDGSVTQGEFEPCEFIIQEVSPATGENIYDNCN